MYMTLELKVDMNALNIIVTDTHWYWGIDKCEAKLTEYASLRDLSL